MTVKTLCTLFLFLLFFNGFSQSDLNKYKYVIVSKKYDFLKQKDEFQLNSLSKFLFNKYGFKAFLEGDDYPEDLKANRCLALRAEALSDPTLFKTQIAIELLDCNDKVVYTSDYGISRLKDMDKAFVDATRKAFLFIKALNYKYKQNESEGLHKVNPAKEAVSANLLDEDLNNRLEAKVIDEGYEVRNKDQKVVMLLIATPLTDCFIVKDKNAIVYKENTSWYYAENTRVKQVLNLHF